MKRRLQNPNQLPPRILGIQKRNLPYTDHIGDKETSPTIKSGKKELFYNFALVWKLDCGDADEQGNSVEVGRRIVHSFI